MNIVISQSMLFPWVGLLEQVKLSDVFVHYDDVQFSKGGFVNRVQIKTSNGRRWMTIPLSNFHMGLRIDEVVPAPKHLWLNKCIALLKNGFSDAPYADEAIELAESVLSQNHENIGQLARQSLITLVNYFELDVSTRFLDISELDAPGSGSDRVLTVVRNLGGTNYITGHGAANYLDHQKFESTGISVEYMDYKYSPYPQKHGAFNPFVSGLDLVANCGIAGKKHICSKTTPWRDYTHEPT